MTTVNITTTSDADWVHAFQYAIEGAPPTPIDLTGSSLRMMVRKHADDAECFINISTPTAGITVTSAADGEFTITLPIASLSRMAEGDYVHSLIRTRPDGLKDEVWHGALTHSIGPTR